MKKLTSIILCVVLLFSVAGCKSAPAPAPSPVPATDVYAQASAELNSRDDVTLELTITTLTTVAGDEFSEESTQTLTYQDKGTSEALILMDESIEYGVHSRDDAPDDDTPWHYSEIWYQDTVYAEMDDTYCFQSSVAAADAAQRYIPVLLFDSALYSSITTEEKGKGTIVHFTQPTAAEAWAIPQGGELVEASGTAYVNSKNVLTKMQYTITYTYGSARIQQSVTSNPLAAPKAITAPSEPDDYAVIGSIDALRNVISSVGKYNQANSLSVHSLESLTSYAGAFVRNHSNQANLHGRKKDTLAKVENSFYFMDYSTEEEERYELEEIFRDGELTTIEDKGTPSTVSLSWKVIRSYISETLLEYYLTPNYWKDVTVTDLGSLYLFEYVLNDDFGSMTQDRICESTWGDPDFLLDLSSDYKNKELNGYLSIDKFSGLPVATGFYYEGVHTIDGIDYPLTLQFDQGIETPAKGAYQEITETLPPEEEPETKPTPVFYHVTGSEGQEMWLFGTIHVGDERTAYLPQAIRDAFEASDALALECNTEVFDKQLEEDEELSDQVSDLYFYSSGLQVIKHAMEDEDYEYALKLLKAVGGYNVNMPYTKPAVWSNIIENFYLQQGYLLHGDQGVEERLMDWAEELDKEIWEIESNMEQLQMMTGYSQELQLWMLEDAMATDAVEYWTHTMELYELWCAGDEAALREEVSSDWNTEDWTKEEIAKYTPLMEEYNKAMSFDRNEGMLETAIEYLESGKVIFYAVGLAHLLDSTNGLVDALQDAGYTVELVTFSELI